MPPLLLLVFFCCVVLPQEYELSGAFTVGGTLVGLSKGFTASLTLVQLFLLAVLNFCQVLGPVEGWGLKIFQLLEPPEVLVLF